MAKNIAGTKGSFLNVKGKGKVIRK